MDEDMSHKMWFRWFTLRSQRLFRVRKRVSANLLVIPDFSRMRHLTLRMSQLRFVIDTTQRLCGRVQLQ